MTRIQTFTGQWITPLDPPHGEINIVDIAHSLAMTCRFSGHCRKYYSVAEHSVVVSELAGHDEDLARWGLMHDASEAYLPDVARPIKEHLLGFKAWEHALLKSVADTFSLPWPIPKDIKYLDTLALKAEAELLMHDREWQIDDYASALGIENFETEAVHIIAVNPYVARELFLERFKKLFPDEEIPDYDFA